MAYTVGCAISFHFIFVAYLLFAEAPLPNHWRRVRDGIHVRANTDGMDNLAPNSTFTEKLWWMVNMVYCVRVVGWPKEPRNGIPQRPPPSRRTFPWETFVKLVMNIAIFDFASSVFALSPAFDSRVHESTDSPETYLAAVPFLHRVPYVLSYGIMMGAGMSIGQNIMALLCVGLGHSNPTLWPDVWGRWGDAYTVRKLWRYARRRISHTLVE